MSTVAAEAAFAAGNRAIAGGDVAGAIGHYREALALAPEIAEVHCNLGAALLMQGDAAGAEAALRAAVSLDPALLVGWSGLGSALIALGRTDEAIQAFLGALSLPAAAVNLGHLLAERGDAAAAEEAYRHALDGAPAAAWNGIGLLRRAAHDLAGALDAFDRALAADSTHLEGRHNRAVALQALGRHHEALSVLRGLARERPDHPAIQASLGHALQGLGRHGEAIGAFECALAALPTDDPKAVALRPFLLHACRYECRWDGIEALQARVLADAVAELARDRPVTAPPFALGGLGASARLVAAASRRISAEADRGTPYVEWPRHDGATLRVGYVSPDFRDHSAGFSIAALLDNHGRDGFSWHGYAIAKADPRFAAKFDRFTDLTGMDDAAAAARMRADRIDVLIDLAGHTKGARLEIFALKPAAAQAHYLGWGLGLGAHYLPYLITDARQTPPEMLVDEVPVYLPDSFMAAGKPAIAAVPSRAAVGLPERAVVIAAFNAPYKLDPDCFGWWCAVLREVPEAVLWLRAAGAVDDRLRVAAAARGVDPGRLIFAPRLPRAEHLARHGLADLAVDTPWHGGGVTTVDALWAGVPVVTLAGQAPAARTGVSLLSAVGLPELVAGTVAAYQALAVRLARDTAWRATIRTKLAANRDTAPLFDAPRLARHLEAAYRAMWRQWRDGSKPSRIDVAGV